MQGHTALWEDDNKWNGISITGGLEGGAGTSEEERDRDRETDEEGQLSCWGLICSIGGYLLFWNKLVTSLSKSCPMLCLHRN